MNNKGKRLNSDQKGRQNKAEDRTRLPLQKSHTIKGKEQPANSRAPKTSDGRKETQEQKRDKLDTPKEKSLENIFAQEVEENIRLRNSDSKPIKSEIFIPDGMLKGAETNSSMYGMGTPPQIHFQTPKYQPTSQNQIDMKNSILPIGAGMGTDDGNSKQIRGIFKRELYGEDEFKKRENQIRMKKELELQMEQNKQKKELEKKKKNDEEKEEHERMLRYQQMEQEKRMELERKELEAKKQKELFNAQQVNLLQEYQQNNVQEKKNKIRRNLQPNEPLGPVVRDDSRGYTQPSMAKNNSFNNVPTGNEFQRAANEQFNHEGYHRAMTDNGQGFNLNMSDHQYHLGGTGGPYMNSTDFRKVHPNNSVSPPSDHNGLTQFTENPMYSYQRQITPLTNFTTNDSVPVEKTVLESLLKENQGLKQEAGRNNIILDFLTNVILKKQSSGQTITNDSPMDRISNTKESLKNKQIPYNNFMKNGQVQIQDTNQMFNMAQNQKKKPFRINTPSNQQQMHNYPKTSLPIKRNNNQQNENFEANRKLKSSSPSQIKNLPIVSLK